MMNNSTPVCVATNNPILHIVNLWSLLKSATAACYSASPWLALERGAHEHVSLGHALISFSVIGRGVYSSFTSCKYQQAALGHGQLTFFLFRYSLELWFLSLPSLSFHTKPLVKCKSKFRENHCCDDLMMSRWIEFKEVYCRYFRQSDTYNFLIIIKNDVSQVAQKM